ncbi:MAG TPA: c-type cytochrome [Blastocatellia bacterium]|nr:c-type cytochrome [Blastocatellia bacterium]
MVKVTIKQGVTALAIGLALAFSFSDLMSPDRAFATSAEREDEQEASNKSAEETMEQKYKNIQALNGLPASQLRPMMTYISASLGVNCAFCHVRNGDQWEYEKDDNNHKKIARRMIRMTMDINKNSFEGRTQVSCYTCHRGDEHTVSIPPLPRVAPVETPRSNEPRPTPQQILAKYNEAIGGKEAVEKIKTRMIKGVSVSANGQTFPLEILFASPDKYSLSVSLPQGATTQKLSGASGWIKNAREDRAMDSVDIQRAKSLAWSLEPLQIKEPYPQMAFGGFDKINGRDAQIVRMALPNKRRAAFYFDKETGLLSRRVVTTDTPIGVDSEQIDYEDYREVEGVKVPHTIRTSYFDNLYSSTRKFTDIKHNAQFDEAQFKLPESK